MDNDNKVKIKEITDSFYSIICQNMYNIVNAPCKRRAKIPQWKIARIITIEIMQQFSDKFKNEATPEDIRAYIDVHFNDDIEKKAENETTIYLSGYKARKSLTYVIGEDRLSHFLTNKETPSLPVVWAFCKIFNISFVELCSDVKTNKEWANRLDYEIQTGNELDSHHPHEEQKISPSEAIYNFLDAIFDDSAPYAYMISQDEKIRNIGALVGKKYHCYYLPLKKRDTSVLKHGVLSFSENNDICYITMSLYEKDPKTNQEFEACKYSGFAIALNPNTDNDVCCHCFLKSQDNQKSDIALISFRWRRKESDNIRTNIRIALALSMVESEDRPVLHRMLLVNEEIDESNYDMIVPHIRLNRSEILISHIELENIYQWLINTTGKKFKDDEEVEAFKEQWYTNFLKLGAQSKGTVYSIAAEHIKYSGKILIPNDCGCTSELSIDSNVLLSLFRSKSVSLNRNKVVEQADDDVRALLRILKLRKQKKANAKGKI